MKGGPPCTARGAPALLGCWVCYKWTAGPPPASREISDSRLWLSSGRVNRRNPLCLRGMPVPIVQGSPCLFTWILCGTGRYHPHLRFQMPPLAPVPGPASQILSLLSSPSLPSPVVLPRLLGHLPSHPTASHRGDTAASAASCSQQGPGIPTGGHGSLRGCGPGHPGASWHFLLALLPAPWRQHPQNGTCLLQLPFSALAKATTIGLAF